MMPFCEKIQATLPPSPRRPLCLMRMWRISPTVRFLLSVRTSSMSATPAGP